MGLHRSSGRAGESLVGAFQWMLWRDLAVLILMFVGTFLVVVWGVFFAKFLGAEKAHKVVS